MADHRDSTPVTQRSPPTGGAGHSLEIRTPHGFELRATGIVAVSTVLLMLMALMLWVFLLT